MTNSVQKLLNNRKVQILIIVILSAFAAISVFQGVRNAIEVSQDFQWDAARAIVERVDPYELSMHPEMEIESDILNSFYKLFTDKGLKQKMEANQFPSLLFILIPYTFLTPLAARYAWIVTNLLLTGLSIWLLRQTFLKNLSTFSYWVCILLMLSGTPFRNQLGVGQHTIFSFSFFLLAVWLDEAQIKGDRIFITICLFICYFKYTLTAPLVLYMLYKKRYMEFAWSVILHILINVIAAFWLGKSILYVFINPLKVSSALSAEGGIDLGALMGGSNLSLIIGAFIAIGLTYVSFYLPKNKEYILFPLLLTWSLIITYHRTYDFFVLSAMPVLFCDDFAKDFGDKIKKYMFFGYCAVLFLIYFGLRIFNENTMSKIIVGFVYYVFAIALFYLAIRLTGRKGENAKLYHK